MNDPFFEKCDPILMKKIVSDLIETMGKPMLVPDLKDITLIDDDTKEEQTLSLNLANPAVLAQVAQYRSIAKFTNGDDVAHYSYGFRLLWIHRFIQDNIDQLKRMDLVRVREKDSLYSNTLYEAAATCKIGKRGFKFKDMLKEINSYIDAPENTSQH